MELPHTDKFASRRAGRGPTSPVVYGSSPSTRSPTVRELTNCFDSQKEIHMHSRMKNRSAHGIHKSPDEDVGRSDPFVSNTGSPSISTSTTSFAVRRKVATDGEKRGLPPRPARADSSTREQSDASTHA